MGDAQRSSGLEQDWLAWHDAYDDPDSGLSWRLRVIQGRIGQVLDAAPAGPIAVISMCAGQGRDLIGAAATHHRRRDVVARLVELDPRNAELARRAAVTAGLAGVEVVTGDASNTSVYAGAVPAQLILACGVFGNVTDADVRTTVANLAGMAGPRATVIWTRHRRKPDLTPRIRAWFAEAGFEEVGFDTHPSGGQAVGTARLVGRPEPFRPSLKLFDFIGPGGELPGPATEADAAPARC